jgi:hypothetical protein
MSNTVTVINKTIPYILRPAFAKKLESPTKDDINKLYTEISSEDKMKPTFFERRSLMDYIATSVLGVGILGSIVGHFKESKGLLGGAGVVAVAGIASFIYKFIKTPALEKLANIVETESTNVKPEVDLSGEMSPEYKQWLTDVKKEIYDQPDYSDRIQELSKRNDLSDEEKAELVGLKEFPDNFEMAELVQIKELGKEPLTPLEETVLESVRLMQRVRSDNLFSGDQEVVDRLKRMLDADKETFLKELKTLLEERPINLLMTDELFKHVLYQRYLVVRNEKGRGSPPLADYEDFRLLFRATNKKEASFKEVLPTDKVLDVFSNIENTRQEFINEGMTPIPKYNPKEVKRGKVYIKGWWNEQPKFGNDLVYSNTVCQSVHGGGARLLKLILTGKHPGYDLENSNDDGKSAKGIQVHPNIKHPIDSYGEDAVDRSRETYSPRSEYYFDTPSLLFLRIEARYLDSQQRDYEAGIRSEFLEHATDFRLENLVTGEVLQGDTLKDIREAIAKSKIGIGNF